MKQKSGPDRLAIGLFLAPALILFLALVLTPIAVAAYTSLYKWNGFGLPTEFIGIGNFERLLEDETFIGDLRRGGLLIALSLVLQLPMSLGLALLLNQKLRGRAFYRLLFFAPYVLSEVTTGVLFTMVFSPSRGVFTDVLWLADPDTVLYSLFLVISWKYFGLHMILYLAGRQSIPKELHEAAETDGAGVWQTFRHVTLPLLGPTIRVTIFLSVIGAIQLFDMVWVLTGGGPQATTRFQAGLQASPAAA